MGFNSVAQYGYNMDDSHLLHAVVPSHYRKYREMEALNQSYDPWSRRSFTGADQKRKESLENLEQVLQMAGYCEPERRDSATPQSRHRSRRRGSFTKVLSKTMQCIRRRQHSSNSQDS
jgi:hypothetical protein